MGGALEVATLKMYVKQREREVYIQAR